MTVPVNNDPFIKISMGQNNTEYQNFILWQNKYITYYNNKIAIGLVNKKFEILRFYTFWSKILEKGKYRDSKSCWNNKSHIIQYWNAW